VKPDPAIVALRKALEERWDVGERVLWDAALALVRDGESRRAALQTSSLHRDPR
jgi:hypothetical protein